MGSRLRCTSPTSAAWPRRGGSDSINHWKSTRYRRTVQRCRTSSTAQKLHRRLDKPRQRSANTSALMSPGCTCGQSRKQHLIRYRQKPRKGKVGCTASSSFKTCCQNRTRTRPAIFIRKQPYNPDLMMMKETDFRCPTCRSECVQIANGALR
jgi:hypothetical protein